MRTSLEALEAAARTLNLPEEEKKYREAREQLSVPPHP